MNNSLSPLKITILLSLLCGAFFWMFAAKLYQVHQLQRAELRAWFNTDEDNKVVRFDRSQTSVEQGLLYNEPDDLEQADPSAYQSENPTYEEKYWNRQYALVREIKAAEPETSGTGRRGMARQTRRLMVSSLMEAIANAFVMISYLPKVIIYVLLNHIWNPLLWIVLQSCIVLFGVWANKFDQELSDIPQEYSQTSRKKKKNKKGTSSPRKKLPPIATPQADDEGW